MSMSNREKIFAAIGHLEGELLNGAAVELCQDPVAFTALIQARAHVAAAKQFIHGATYALDLAKERPAK